MSKTQNPSQTGEGFEDFSNLISVIFCGVTKKKKKKSVFLVWALRWYIKKTSLFQQT